MEEIGILYHVTTVVSLLVFKLAVLFVGYLIAKLGHDLLIKGVTGEFKFHTQFKESTADLISASPGLFFILMATILISIGILKDKPFETKVTERIIKTGAETKLKGTMDTKPPVPQQLKEKSYAE